MPGRHLVLLFLATGGLAVWPSGAARAGAGAGQTAWNWDLTAGFDSFTHSYALANTDTSETVTEFMTQAGFEGRSANSGASRWRVRGEASAGTDLWRERLEADWRRVDHGGSTRVRAAGRLWGRQYRDDSDYARSSNQVEGRGELQVVPWAARHAELTAGGWGTFTGFATPSPLEQNLREFGAVVGARSRGLTGPQWTVSLRRAARSYPDSAAIDRKTWSLDGDVNHQAANGGSVRLFHRSERRLAAEPDVRPDAWSHWTDVAAAVPALAGQATVEIQSESWRYGQPTEIYLDCWRLSGVLGYRRGDILGPQWSLGLAGERFEAGDSPESYAQAGVRAGIESLGGRLNGSLSVEYGRRDYAGNAAGEATADDVTGIATDIPYSDFNYWKLWLLGEWRLGPGVSLQAMASWEPERHTASADDASLGFTNLRLVWRP
jgi:hypothetical protein